MCGTLPLKAVQGLGRDDYRHSFSHVERVERRLPAFGSSFKGAWRLDLGENSKALVAGSDF